MKQVDEMPTSGQFVAVWSNVKDVIWSENLKWFGNKLFSYEEDEDKNADDCFCKIEKVDFFTSVNAKYFIAD